MKKLMVALVAVAFAAVAQAASFNWGATGTNTAKTFYSATGTTLSEGTMVYLMEAGTINQMNLIAALRDGKTMADYSTVTTSTLDANSRLVGKSFDYGTTEGYNFYMVVVDGDMAFVSNSVAQQGQASASTAINFAGIKTATSKNFGMGDYSAAGWYQTVPEPTSGLLLLLGMAGLALKRKQA